MPDEYIDLGINTASECNIGFDDNDIVEEYKKPSFKTHLEDGDKLVWYKDPTIVATWHSDDTVDLFDKTRISVCSATFRAKFGRWKESSDHGVGKEPNHWLFNGEPIANYLQLFNDFWDATEEREKPIKEEKKQRRNKENTKVESKEATKKKPLSRYERLVQLLDPDMAKEVTPEWVVNDMLDLLPDSVWCRDTKFLDIYSKSGIFLTCIKEHLMTRAYDLIEEFPDEKDREEYIIQNQLYAITWTFKRYADITRNIINGTAREKHHIAFIKADYRDLLKATDNGKILNDIFKKIFEEEFDNVKINVVVGNPPYNNDIYIPFVELGHKLAKQCSCFITPAKWQAKGGEKNEQFRKNIVPYMKKIVYYPNSMEVFDIQEPSGISYYLIDKSEYQIKSKIVHCSINKAFECCEYKGNITTLHGEFVETIIKKTHGKSLGERLNFSQSFYVKNTEHGREKRLDSDIPIIQGENGISGYVGINELRNTDGLNMWKVVQLVMPVDTGKFDSKGRVFGINKCWIIEPNAVCKGSYAPLIFFNTREECESFSSYCDCRLPRFLYACSFSGMTITKEFWRFVPDPGAFDHIFTDEELYAKYGLTDEEIEIIESVIKERK